MSETRDPGDEEPGGSPPCFLHELGLDGAPADAQPARDVARWRKAERSDLSSCAAHCPRRIARCRVRLEMLPQGLDPALVVRVVRKKLRPLAHVCLTECSEEPHETPGVMTTCRTDVRAGEIGTRLLITRVMQGVERSGACR